MSSSEASTGRLRPETFRAIRKRVREMLEQQFNCWREELKPALAKNCIHFLDVDKLGPEDSAWVEKYYRAQVRPVLTPLGIDPSHPFPQLLNKSLNIVVQLDIERNGETQRRLAVVQVPRVRRAARPLAAGG
jgi:polyphosphate kinase